MVLLFVVIACYFCYYVLLNFEIAVLVDDRGGPRAEADRGEAAPGWWWFVIFEKKILVTLYFFQGVGDTQRRVRYILLFWSSRSPSNFDNFVHSGASNHCFMDVVSLIAKV